MYLTIFWESGRERGEVSSYFGATEKEPFNA